MSLILPPSAASATLKSVGGLAYFTRTYRSRCPSDPPLRALRKRLQLHTTDQDLGAFGLKLNLSFRVRGFVSVIDDLSVEDVRKLVVPVPKTPGKGRQTLLDETATR
jgi:hypothetical protein